jgi:aryl-alcohol dehydrogenase-like predicted oxidoreductase
MSFCSPSESRIFFENSFRKGIKANHFKKFRELYLTGLGMGTYLGAMNREVDILIEKAITESVTSGVINVIDTAINYRYQLSERAIGRAINVLFSEGIKRGALFISTKNGYLTGDAELNESLETHISRTLLEPKIISIEDIAAGSHCMSPAFLKNQLNRSLTNLKLKSIDLMYLHNSVESQQPIIGKEEFIERLKKAFGFYEKARIENKIKFYGMATWDSFRVNESDLSYFNLEDVELIATEVGGNNHGFRFIQLPYNILFQEARLKRNQRVNNRKLTLIEAASSLDIGIFTSVPLLQSKLLQLKLPQIDKRDNPLICLDFVRSTPGIIAPIVGHKKHEHVDKNLNLGKLDLLNKKEFDKIKNSIDSFNA